MNGKNNFELNKNNESTRNNFPKNNAEKLYNDIRLLDYPEFGTSYCPFENNQTDKKNYFIPISSYNKNFPPNIHRNCKMRYEIYKNPENNNPRLFDIYIFLNDNKEMFDFQIEINSVSQIILEEKENDNKNIIYFYLKNPPKISYKNCLKINLNAKIMNDGKKYNGIKNEKISTANYNNINKEFYFNSFRNNLINYKYINHYHENDKIQKIEHKNNSHILFIKRNELSDTSKINLDDNLNNQFVRIDSFLSKNNEYQNFYLLNLIMKIKVNFYSEKDFNFIKNKINKNININEPNDNIIFQAKTLLEKYTTNFYNCLTKLDFSLQYSILSFITTKKINIFNYAFFNKIMKGFIKLNCEDQEIMSKTLNGINIITLENQDLGTIIGTKFNQLKNENLLNNSIDNKDYVNYIKNIEVTPSLIYYKIPILEKNNELIRFYNNYFEHFVKININDEDHSKLYFSNINKKTLLEIHESLMKNGLMVGTRIFKYLNKSNSQIKNGGGWFFNLEGTKFNSTDEIMNEMGNFSTIKNKYKNAIRRGQCVSSTTPIIKLKKENIKLIPEIKSSNGKYIYSDGIGKISLCLANKCFEKLKNNDSNINYSSAIQIRLGGIKGVVAIDPKLKNKDIICYRNSMKKFESENYELGIIKISKYGIGYLNRQIITLLSGLGVPNDIFINMMSYYVKNYEVCLNYLKNNDMQLSHYLNENKELYTEILSKCFYFKPLLKYYLYKREPKYFINEPFIQMMLISIISFKMLKLKTKGKIFDKESTSLIGVIDETGILKHNEVFIHIIKSSEYNEDNEINLILNQEIFVTKNPCLYPGDIRILNAVNNEKIYSNLYHMINVIVFSSQDSINDMRPIQNQISGGDLDGDIYYVSWNKKIIENIIKRNIKPLEDPNYSNNYDNEILYNIESYNNNNDNKLVGEKEILSSYIDILENDLVPRISNLYIAHADNDLKNGPFSEKCMELSKIFLIAIDSQKTGKFINKNIFEEKKLSLNFYPDFLETKDKNYKSPGILGILYRLCDMDKFLKQYEIFSKKINIEDKFLTDKKLIDINCLQYTSNMFKLYKEYENDIKNLILKYDFDDEISFFLDLDIYNKKKKKNKDAQQQFIELKSVIKKYKNKIHNIFGDHINKSIARACYLVTYMNDSVKEEYSLLFKNNKYWLEFLEEWKEYCSEKKKKYNLFENDGKNNNLSIKKILSFPWVIFDIRNVLFDIC